MKYEPGAVTCLAGLCDNCTQQFLIPAKTPLDMLVTCPTCFHVDECVEFASAWNELREITQENGYG